MPSYNRPTYKDLTKKEKDFVRQRAEGKCEICGTTENCDCHHMIPRRILEMLCPEKQNDPSILVYACKQCHKDLDNDNKRLIKLYKQIESKEKNHQVTLWDLLEGNYYE